MKKRKDGRYQKSVILIDPESGKKRRLYAYGYTEEEVLRELKRLKLNFGKKSYADMAFDFWLNQWLKIKKEEVAATTYENYVLRINKHILPYLKNVKLRDIYPQIIRNIIAKVPGQRSKKYIYTLLHAILEQAYKDDLIKKNPCIAVSAPKYRAEEKEIIPLDMFLQILKVASPVFKNIYRLAYYTGMRRGEICALKWGDIDFNQKTISITKSAKILFNRLEVGSPKTESGVRTILVSKQVLGALHDQYKRQVSNYFSNGDRVTADDFVFTGESYNKMMSPGSLSKNFTKVKTLLHIKNSRISFHSFRHTHTTILVEAGIPIKAIQTRLGHSSAAFTMSRYAHNTEKMQNDIVSLLNEKG